MFSPCVANITITANSSVTSVSGSIFGTSTSSYYSTLFTWRYSVDISLRLYHEPEEDVNSVLSIFRNKDYKIQDSYSDMDLPFQLLPNQAWFIFSATAFVLTYIAGAYWIFVDSKERGHDNPYKWVAYWAILNIITLGYYLVVRDNIGQRTSAKNT